MHSGDRLLGTLLGEPFDRPPYHCLFGPGATTRQRWHEEGLPEGQPWAAEFGFDAGWAVAPVNLGWSPQWEEEIIEVQDDFVIKRDQRRGIIIRDRKDAGPMPEWLDYPVQPRHNLEPVQPQRFNAHAPPPISACDPPARPTPRIGGPRSRRCRPRSPTPWTSFRS